MQTLHADDPLAVAVVAAIRTGDSETLTRLLRDHPGLAATRIAADPDDEHGQSRTLLHVATDWPGHFPGGPATVAALAAAGADVDARFQGPHRETPLHWAASSDDVPVLEALLDAGADIEADGGVIGGGTALADARAFGQWRAAGVLVDRGASTTLVDAATLGLLDRVERFFGAPPPPTADEVTEAFWGACHGGRLACAEHLLARGADPSWIGPDDLTPLDAARRSGAGEVVRWLEAIGARAGGERP